jgi:hypothetical protein
MPPKNSKKVSFSFSMPLPSIKKDSGRLVVSNNGEMLVCAVARISGALGDLPLAFADQKENEIRITIESVHYSGVDILPVLNLPEAKVLLESIHRAAYNSLVHIQNY